MAISAVSLGNIHDTSVGPIAYGTSLPVGTWIIIIHTGAGQGGTPNPTATDTAGNTFPPSAGAITNNNNPCTYIQSAKLTHAVISTDTISPLGTVLGSIEAFYLTGAATITLGAVTGKSQGLLSPFSSAHATDLRLPAFTADGTELILGGVSAVIVTSPPDPTKALNLDVGGAQDQEGLGNWFTNATWQVIPPAGSALVGAQVTGPSGSTADAWNSNAIAAFPVTTAGPSTGPGGGLSLARSSAGFMFAAWSDGVFVVVARSTDQGATWKYRLVASDAATLACPWLCIDPRTDELFLFYHSAAGFLSVWRLPGLLEETPISIITANPITFPCAVIPRPGLMVIAGFDGTTLKAYQSLDWGQTLTQVETFGTQAVERPALILDRHGSMHLFYRSTGGDLYNNYCASPVGDGWQGATLFVSPGKYPGLAAGPLDAFVTWYGTADALSIARLQPNYHTLSNTVGLPTTTFLPISPGTWIDEKDGWWFLGRHNTNSVGSPPPPSYPGGDPGGGGVLVGSPGGGGGGIGDGSGFEGAALGAIGMDPF